MRVASPLRASRGRTVSLGYGDDASLGRTTMAQRILITAGAGGIGLAVPRAFAADGGRVHICDVSADAIREVTKGSANITGSIADVSDRAAVQRLCRTCRPVSGALSAGQQRRHFRAHCACRELRSRGMEVRGRCQSARHLPRHAIRDPAAQGLGTGLDHRHVRSPVRSGQERSPVSRFPSTAIPKRRSKPRRAASSRCHPRLSRYRSRPTRLALDAICNY